MNLEKEFQFIIKETHKERGSSKNFFKRRLIFIMQMLLPKGEFKMYKYLKKIYLKMDKKDIEKISQVMWKNRDLF